MIRLGILGGGQLAQMMAQAAVSLGIEIVIFERAADSPASRLTHHHIAAAWDDSLALRRFADLCDVVTLENEFVDAGVLDRLAAMGLPVWPSARTLGTVQDKFTQKTAMQTAGIAVPPFRAVTTPDAVIAAGADFGWPLLLKARRDGYDGYGNATVEGPDAVAEAWHALGAHDGRALMVEGYVDFVRELAVMALRGQDGEVRLYPVVETVQRDHICHVVRAPAAVDTRVWERACSIARTAVEAIGGVGVFGVELFELADGRVLYNEIAPRPHNSGHYTIEGCVTSQFENHMRAVLGWPPGDTALVAPAAVMVNALGGRQGDARADVARAALAVPGAHVHIYAKRTVRPGRKMGHVTVVGESVAEAEGRAREAVALLEF